MYEFVFFQYLPQYGNKEKIYSYLEQDKESKSYSSNFWKKRKNKKKRLPTLSFQDTESIVTFEEKILDEFNLHVIN